MLGRLRAIVGKVLGGQRQRIHGDYHLGQVLYTGNDFSIIDYEGEPSRPLSERKIKRSPLRDVAGMLRSFDYAVQTALRDQLKRGMDQANEARAQAFGRYWYAWVSAAYLSSYVSLATANGTIAKDSNEVAMMLDVWMIGKAVYELGYELNNRPDWLEVPALGLEALLGRPDGALTPTRAQLSRLHRLARLYDVLTSYDRHGAPARPGRPRRPYGCAAYPGRKRRGLRRPPGRN